MLPPRLLLSFCLMFLPVLCLGQERQKTSAVPETCPATTPATQSFVPPPPYLLPLTVSFASCKTIRRSILVRDGQAMDRSSKDRSLDWVRALHPQRSDIQTKAGFLATRI